MDGNGKATMGTKKRNAQLSAAAGLGAGLYVARVAVELGPLPLPGWGSALLAGACALAGVGLTWRTKDRTDLKPLLAVWAYVLYPQIAPGVAFGAGFAGLAATVVRNLEVRSRKKARWALPAGVFLSALILYTLTLSPGLLTADNAEYQLVAARLGVAHPPGYALYTLLGKLFTLLPLGTPAWRVNLFAAVTAALALALVARTVRRLTNSAWGGIAAALALGVAPTFWAQSTTANIRGLTLLFAAWCFDALVAFGQAHKRGESSRRQLDWFALGLGLGIFHHFSLGFLLPAFGLYLLAVDPALIRRPRRWVRPALIFAGTAAILAYFPIRGAMGALLAPDHLTTVGGFLEHVLGLGFGGDMFAFLQWGVLPHRFAVLGDILVFQFGGPLLIAAGAGLLLLLLQRDPRRALLFGGGFALFFFLVATYRAPQTVEYLMPAYVPVAVAVGYAAGALSRMRRWPPLGPWLAALILLPGLLRLGDHYSSFAALHHDRTARNYAEPILRAAPPYAVILSNWHWATAFWYLQHVEDLRPDVDVIYVYPQGESYAANWIACIDAAPDAQPECRVADPTAHPLIVTDWYDAYAALPYRLTPFHEAFLVQRESLEEPPPGLAPLDVALDEQVRLLGYALSDDAVTPGGTLAVHLAWQPLSAWDRDYSFFVQLLGPDGLIGQGRDQIHPAGRYRIGEVIVDRFELSVWPTVPPGEYVLAAGVYFTPEGGGWQRLTAPDGRDSVSLGAMRVTAAAAPPVTLHPLHHRFASGPTLVGADFDHSPGLPRRVYLHWRLPSGSGDGYEVLLLANGEPAASGRLPALAEGGYLTIAHDVPAGALAVSVRPAGAQADAVHVTLWGFHHSGPVALPESRPGDRYVPLGGEMALVGAEMTPGVRLSADEGCLLGVADGPGEILQIDLRWLSLGALTRDRVVSVQATAWGINHDSVPALGAVPTLKWIRGAEVRDRHFLRLPAETLDEAALSLVVYDHFVQRQQLPILDERLARLGSMVPLGTAAGGE